MAKVSIIREDATVTVDGFFNTQDVSSISSDTHAIQWDTTTNTGHIEYNDGKANESITSVGANIDTMIAANATAKTADDDAKAVLAANEAAEVTKANEQTALEATYGWKRQQEYPSVGDQLDSLYHAGTFDATMTAALKAIKDKYPK